MKTEIVGRLIGNDGYHECETRCGYFQEGDGWAAFVVTGKRMVTTYSLNTEEECDALINALNKE